MSDHSETKTNQPSPAPRRMNAAERGFNYRHDRGAPIEKPKEGRQTLRRMISYFRREWALVLLMILVVTAGVIASVLAPGFQSSAIDRIVASDYSGLAKYLKIMMAAYILYGICLLLQGYISAWLSQKIVKALRHDLFNKIIHLPVSFIDRQSHGDLMSRMTNDAENISSVISESMSSLFSGVLTLIGTLIMMLYFSVPLALISCSTVILTVLITTVLTKKTQHYYLQRQVLLGQVNGITEEMITNQRTITAYNRQDAVIREFSKTSDHLTRTGIISEIVSGSMGPVMNMLGNISFVLVAVFGAWFALNGRITVGVISAFIVYAKQFSRPINELAQLYGQIETALAGAERIFSVLDEEEEKPQGQALAHPVHGVIEFQHVNFSYVEGKQVIRDFNLVVGSGKKIALVGSTGSGKTTIINLLMRFYQPDSGQILLDGKDIQTLDLYELRRNIGIVLQDSVLFSGSVRENLTYAKPEASEEEILSAADASNADKVIEALPNGYDTKLTQAGSSLSAGQRQLLTIGRAFLSHPHILIFDEATSSVDTRTESNIQNAMVRLMKDRTSLIIAHRLSTIQDADEIIVMDSGRIVESGNHRELLEKKGQYYTLYMTQFAGQAT